MFHDAKHFQPTIIIDCHINFERDSHPLRLHLLSSVISVNEAIMMIYMPYNNIVQSYSRAQAISSSITVISTT